MAAPGSCEASGWCATVLPPYTRAFSDFLVENILSYVVASFVVFNFGVARFSRVVERHSSYPHLPDDVRRAAPVKLTQLVLCVPLLFGLPVLLLMGATPCDLSMPYVLGVCTLVPMYELYELARLWPLRFGLAVHHYATLFATLLFRRALRSSPMESAPWPLVAFFPLLALQWGADSFGLAFKMCRDVERVGRSRKLYLASAVPRALNTAMIVHLALAARRLGASPLAVAIIAFLAVAYGGLHAQLIVWAARFDYRAYFQEHQATWPPEGSAAAANGRPKRGSNGRRSG